MDKALWESSARRSGGHRKAVEWQRKMSDNVAFALLVYTGLQIFVTMGALDTNHGSILPYFGLVLLVAAIIPACRLFEQRWERLTASGASPEQLAPLFNRDRLILWLAAIGLPFVVTGLIKLLLEFF